MVGFLFFIIIFVPFLLFNYKLYQCYKEKHYISIIFIIILIMIIIILYNNLTIFSCKGWDIGLNNTKINNNNTNYACEIKIPKKNKCYINRMDGVFDMSKIFKTSCDSPKILEKEKFLLLKSLSKEYFGVSKLNHFGYPITVGTEKYNMYSCQDLKDYMNIVNKGIIKMDLYNEKNYPNIPPPEVELFFDDKNYGKININVIKNETLSEERKKISESKNSLYNNVLMIYLDAISRNHFQRKIKKLSKLIEPFMIYNLNETEKKFTAFQFMKYQTLKALTIPNIKAMFYGVGLKEGYGINLVKYYKNQGYVTGHTGTTCGKEIFSVNALLKSQKLDYDSWDHENIAMFCDPNFFAPKYPLNKGIASVLKRCLYGKYAFEYMMEYTKQFWMLYKDNKKFFRLHFNEGHEGTMELISYLDEPLFKFVKFFFDNNLLNDTFLFILSDHGNHMLGPWSILRPQDYLIESNLATLFFVVPNNKKLYKNGLYDIIKRNTQIFITPYDIHDTLINIAFGNNELNSKTLYSRRGNSLLQELNPFERFCESPKLNLSIKKSDCKCIKY